MNVRIGDRVRVSSNKNGPYKNLTATVVKIIDDSGIRVTFDKKYEIPLEQMGYMFKNAYISNGSYDFIDDRKNCIEVE